MDRSIFSHTNNYFVFLSFLFSNIAIADTVSSVESYGLIASECVFAPITYFNGVLKASPSLTHMSSLAQVNGGYSGGRGASISFYNTMADAFKIIVSTPTDFAEKPSSFNDNPIFATTYSFKSTWSNGHLSPSVAGIPATQEVILTEVGMSKIYVRNDVDNGNSVFYAGDYKITNTVTCAAI